MGLTIVFGTVDGTLVDTKSDEDGDWSFNWVISGA